MSDDQINRKLYDKIAQQIKDDLEKSDDNPRLIDISALDDFKDKDIKTILKVYYDSTDPIYRLIGTILNSVFTHGYNVFVITQKYLNDLLKIDKAAKSNTCDGKTYKKVMAKMYTRGDLVCLRKAIQNSLGVSGKSGLYEMTNAEVIEALSKTIGINTLMARREQSIEWFDKNNPDYVNDAPTAEILEERKRIREKLNERKKRNT